MKKQVVLKVDHETYKRFKMLCVSREIGISEAVERLMEKSCEKSKILNEKKE